MSNIKRYFDIFKFWLIIILIDFYQHGIILRYRLIKKRFFMYVLTSIVFIILIKHCDYVYYDFAFNEIHKYSKHLGSNIWQIDANWYFKNVEHGHTTLVILFVGYQIYFLISNLWLSLYGFIGKHKEDITFMVLGYLIMTNDWYIYGYIFYVCQIKVLILALFLYNFWYWMFMLVLWDEEMEAYYQNQVDLANLGRENFIPQNKDSLKEKKQENYLEEFRPDLMDAENLFEPETFEEWKKKQGISDILNETNLQLKGEYIEDSVVETVWDLETRYKQHILKFYGQQDDDDPTSRKETSPIVFDEEVELEMVKYLVFFRIRYWEEVYNWRLLHKYDKYRIYLLSFWHMIKAGQFTFPHVVGPYSVFSPYFLADPKKLSEWERYKFLVFLKNLFSKFFLLFSFKYRYQQWRWTKFDRRFKVQLKLLKQKNSINYVYFKSK